MIRYSRQRECIKNCLANRCDHPTAELIYQEVKRDFPNISMGTVYRNLSLLADMGEIRKITMEAGPDRFDGNIRPHYHFICRICGCLADIQLKDPNHLNRLAQEEFDGLIEEHSIQFSGKCPACMNLSQIPREKRQDI